MSADAEPALLRLLGRELPWSGLGSWPTPVESLREALPELGAASLYVKRDDLSSAIYGGTKVRALEPLFGAVVRDGARRVCASGACGSHSLVATALHAERLGLGTRVVAFAQPASAEAGHNLRQVLSRCEGFGMLPHWSLVPASLGVEVARSAGDEAVLPPALMSPLGALGHVSGALELAEQVARGELAPPQRVVMGLGSACTAAGLLVGFWLAKRLGLLRSAVPRLVAVRIAPWPLASGPSAVALALRTARLVAELLRKPAEVPSWRELSATLTVDGSQLGPGYGHGTAGGHRALERFRAAGLCPLDEVYSAKIAAGFFEWVRRGPRETTLLWATHSSARLAPPSAPSTHVPKAARRFLRGAARAG